MKVKDVISSLTTVSLFFNAIIRILIVFNI